VFFLEERLFEIWFRNFTLRIYVVNVNTEISLSPLTVLKFSFRLFESIDNEKVLVLRTNSVSFDRCIDQLHFIPILIHNVPGCVCCLYRWSVDVIDSILGKLVNYECVYIVFGVSHFLFSLL